MNKHSPLKPKQIKLFGRRIRCLFYYG